MKEEYFIVKNGKQKKIPKPKSIQTFLNKGYVVSIVRTEGTKTSINTFSPRTYAEAQKEHRERNPGVPF